MLEESRRYKDFIDEKLPKLNKKTRRKTEKMFAFNSKRYTELCEKKPQFQREKTRKGVMAMAIMLGNNVN